MVDTWKGQRALRDARDENVHRLAELLPETRTPRFVPLAHFQHLVFGLRPEDDIARHVLTYELRPHFGPGHCRARVLEMFSPTPIELGTVRFRQFEFAVPLGIGETLPQGHCKFGAVTGRQFEQFRQGTQRHDLIVARPARCRNSSNARAGEDIRQHHHHLPGRLAGPYEPE